MRLHRVKVIGCKLPSYWYAKATGKEFTVFDVGYTVNGFAFQVIYEGTHDERPTPSYIQVSDCEVLETFEGRIVEQVTISVERK